MASADLFEMNKFLTQKLNLPRKLFATDDQIREFLAGMAKMQQQQQLPPPSPKTAAGAVKFPEASNVTI